MSSFWTVVRYTFKQRFSSKASITSLIILSILISIGINVPYLISLFNQNETKKVGMVQNTEFAAISEKISMYFEQTKDEKIQIVLLPDTGSREGNESQAREQIESGELAGYLELLPSEGGDFPKAVYLSEKAIDMSTNGRLTSALQMVKTELIMHELGLSADQFARLNAPIVLDSALITSNGESGSEPKDEKQMIISYVLVYALIVLLFMGVMMYGNLIATEVTAEKSSRVMEILITSISPLKQMFGKVIGMMLLGLSQICIYIVVAVINVLLPHNVELLSEFDVSLSDIPFSLIAGFIFFYLSGFLMYAFLFAAVGSIVSRTEELGQAIMPLTMLLLAAFYIAIFGLNSPNSSFMVGASFVPLFTPMLMFLRIGVGEIAVWEIALSIVIMIGSIIFFGWLSAKIYRVGVLLYGKRPSLKEIRKAMKAYKV